MFPGKFNLDVQGLTIIDAVTPDIGLAMVADTDDTAIFRIELAYRVVHRIAAVLTEGYDYLVL